MTDMTVRVHLKSGQTIAFQADRIRTERDKISGEIDKLEWDGATGEVPQAFGAGMIAAVTVEHTERHPEDTGV